ncbi:MAG: hypothetical protein OXB88_00295 [Bacteriovoracales bacterium]|nr:hypothetical protein [Bacteriovoracales bacterium]
MGGSIVKERGNDYHFFMGRSLGRFFDAKSLYGMRIPSAFLFAVLLPLFFSEALAQFSVRIPKEFQSDDLVVGGDIFDDFNENLELEEVLEDERFLRYGRFFALNLGIGFTDFTGNRGLAYENSPPSTNFGLMAFTSFHVAFLLGFAQSKHSMFFSEKVQKDPGEEGKPLGLIDVNTFRTYVAFRYYIDTTDLTTALTYSNPYFSLRFEHWNLANKFIDRDDIADERGGGMGIGFGWGLEFPVKLKRSYINYEFLVHTVNFYDRLTNDYQDAYTDLDGVGVSNVVNYVISW